MTGRNTQAVNDETFIRQLPYSVIKYISLLLDIDKQWERFVLEIPKSLQEVGENATQMRYTNLHVRLFERKESPTKAIIDDWGTQNTRVKHLVRVLQEAALYEAADYISVNVLQKEKVTRLGDESEPPGSLPRPSWHDQDVKKANGKEEKGNLYMDLSEPNGYGHQKEFGRAYSNEDNAPPTYNSLMKQGEDESGYNKLLPDSKVNNYHTPSFTSGSNFSDVLKAGNKPEHETAVEHAETFQVRPIKGQADFKENMEDPYSYAYSGGQKYKYAKDIPEESSGYSVQKVVSANKEVVQSNIREPCETTDDTSIETGKISHEYENSNQTDLENDNLYKIIANQKLTYSALRLVTDDFNPESIKNGGRVIGTGGFGDVFLGQFENGFKCAVKRLKNVEEVDKQFETELNSLMKYRHRNIVRLYGFSVDGPDKCLVYEYLCNGSLEDRLMRKDNTPPIPNEIRLNILKGTAEGIYFLNKQGVVHRDIKSANVLLDEIFEAKVGDFATARVGPRGNETMRMSTQVVIGTSAYLAPEAMTFDISTKLDSYSFGIVILEVLTALPPLDHDREDKDLKSHVEENHITDLLDTSGGKWMEDTVAKLVGISEKCTYRKKQRSNIEDILSELLAVS